MFIQQTICLKRAEKKKLLGRNNKVGSHRRCSVRNLFLKILHYSQDESS